MLPKYPPVEDTIDLQRKLREVAPSLCHRRSQGHVPSSGLLHGFLQVPSASTGEEDHTLGRPVLRPKMWCQRCPFNQRADFSISIYKATPQSYHTTKWQAVLRRLQTSIHDTPIPRVPQGGFPQMPTLFWCLRTQNLQPNLTSISAGRWIPEVVIPTFAPRNILAILIHDFHPVPVTRDSRILLHGLCFQSKAQEPITSGYQSNSFVGKKTSWPQWHNGFAWHR